MAPDAARGRELPCTMIAEEGVILRKKFELNSAKLGTLEEGDRVTVYDIIPHDAGLLRARVVVDGGALSKKEGFVTLQKKDGKRSLYEASGVLAYTKTMPKGAMEAARAAFEVFDVDGSGSLSAEELKEILTRPTAKANGVISQGLSDEEVRSIIETFDVNGDGELQFEEFAVMWAPLHEQSEESPSPPAKENRGNRGQLSSLIGRSFAKKAAQKRGTFSFKRRLGFGGGDSAASASSSAVLGSVLAMANSADGKATSGSKGKQKEKKKGRGGGPITITEKEVKLMTSIGVAAMRNEVRKYAEAAEARVAEVRSLPALLGAALKQGDASVASVVREWDVMGSGEISRTEFRNALRHPKLGIQKEFLAIATIDALFDALDEDHGGSLDLQEMTTALQTFKEKADEMKSIEKNAKETAELFRRRAQQVETCAEQTKEYEEAVKELAQVQASLASVEKDVKQELENRQHAQSHNPVVLRNIEKAQQRMVAEEKLFTSKTRELRKAAQAAQAQVVQALRQDQVAESAREEAEAQAKEAARLAKVKAREEAKARRAAKLANLALEKADFEERVSRKRLGSSLAAPGAAAPAAAQLW